MCMRWVFSVCVCVLQMRAGLGPKHRRDGPGSGNKGSFANWGNRQDTVTWARQRLNTKQEPKCTEPNETQVTTRNTNEN